LPSFLIQILNKKPCGAAPVSLFWKDVDFGSAYEANGGHHSFFLCINGGDEIARLIIAT
jgi:hypothetical protein